MTDGVGLLSDVLVRRGKCPPVGQIAGANTVDTQTRVVKYQPLYSRVKAADGGVTLQFASLSINAGSDHAAALRFISESTEPFRVGDLPGLAAPTADGAGPDPDRERVPCPAARRLMELADLARWTPIRFDFSGSAPTVDWADLRGERFVEPFFDDSVARWASGPRAAQLVRTGLDALVALDDEPSLEPAGMIFHLSRCGSTLVSRLLSTLPGVVVLAEPSPLNALLGLDPDRVDQAAQVQVVRLLVRALGRRRHADEKQFVLKCTSWNIRAPGDPCGRFP